MIRPSRYRVALCTPLRAVICPGPHQPDAELEQVGSGDHARELVARGRHVSPELAVHLGQVDQSRPGASTASCAAGRP
jgi:hypothetical protein